MDSDQKIEKLIGDVLFLIEKYGSYSNEVKRFVQKYQSEGDFLYLAATIIYMINEKD